MPAWDYVTGKPAFVSKDVTFFLNFFLGRMTLFSLKFNILIECILCLVGILTDSSQVSKLEKPDRHCIFFLNSLVCIYL